MIGMSEEMAALMPSILNVANVDNWKEALSSTMGLLSAWASLYEKPTIQVLFPTGKTSPLRWHRCMVCKTLCRPYELMCLPHWTAVPVPLRMRVMAEFRPILRQSSEWVNAAIRAVFSVADVDMPLAYYEK